MSKHASNASNLQFRTKLVLVGFLLFAIGSVFSATGASAAPSANLDQCANGSVTSPNVPACDPDEWVNGNLGASKATYFEGDSIPYRMLFGDLALASHTITFEWDTTKSGKHAIDYLTTFNRTVTTANPCAGVSGCNPAVFDSEPIPVDPQVTGGGVTQIVGDFRLYGGTITNVSVYSYADGTGFVGDKSARITITFTAAVANPVLAWGGHIATRADWGSANSAVAISGSPYHMRLIDLDGSGGNQDRSLSAAAVIFPASITIIKDAVPNDAQNFGFTTTGGLSPASFTLDDDSDPTLSNTQQFTGITNFTTYTVTEGVPAAHWSLTTLTCSVTSPNGGSQTTNVGTRTATINLNEGENVTCTFTNTHQVASPSINTTLSDDSITVGDTIHDSAALTNATSDAGGTVTYSIYTENTCTTAAGAADGVVGTPGTVNVTNGVVPDSGNVTFNKAGDFFWQAVYSGDPNNSGAISVCASEHLVVGKASPAITTTATDATVGGAIHDTATMTGLVNAIDGTITFTAYSDNLCVNDVFTDTVGPITANGDYDSADFTPANTGNFFWVASYSGDANNDPASTSCGDEGETSVVSPASPAITTTATDATVGGAIHDTATMTGLVNAIDGTITFTAYSDNLCVNDVFTDTVGPITANGDYDSADFTPANTGNFFWVASYSGDANNDPASTSCGDEGETSVVSPASPAITTTATDATVGGAIHDTATMTGLVNAIDGTITFTAYSDNLCVNDVFTDTVGPITANGDYDSADFTPANTGNFFWVASYSGDANNDPASTSCGDEGETSVVSPASPAITTTATDATVGGAIHDTATMTGLVNAIDGTITFTAYSDNLCVNDVFTDTVGPITANGDYDSADFTPANTGNFFWVASYSGDANNDPASTSCGDEGETSVVSPASPAITTTATDATVGGAIHDTATMTGLVNAIDGTITFTAYSDNLCVNDVFTDTVGPITANGDYDSADFTPANTGNFFWVASYSGDANNDPASTSCGDEGETSVVSPASPAITTTATDATVGGAIHDTATMTGLVNAIDGTITFTAYSDNLCVNDVFTDTVGPITANGDYDSADFTPANTGNFFWVASYSGDANNDPASTSCGDEGETSVVSPASPAITTTATDATVGGAIHDTATMTGLVNAIDGTITFTAYSDNLCVNDVFTDTVGPITANGDYDSADFTPANTGNFFWVASYSGDANNDPASTSCGDEGETSVVSPASPAITTTATDATVGGAIHDTATMTGLVNAIDGTITFTAYSDNLCVNDVFTDTVGPITANGDYDSADFTPANTGNFFWVASYSGDANNDPASTSCGDEGETSVVSPASPAITTTATDATVGGAIHDTATMTGLVNAIDGTITFTAYSDNLCVNDVFTDTVGPITANGDYDSADFTPANTGNFFWVASYSGDANNDPASTSCGDEGETSVVSPASPAITTTATDATVGGAIHDTATMTGLVNAIDGTITFTAYSDNLCVNDVFTDTVGPITANGDYDSADFTPANTGNFFWVASYSGDANNDPASTSCGDEGETSVVSPASPAITTTATDATVGGAIHDTATMTGLVNAIDGTITFTAYSDNLCVNDVFTDTVGPITANGDYDSADFTPANTGNFFWVASYSGDANNDPASTSCGDEGETSVVSPASPAITTTATDATVGGAIHDTATMTGLVNAIDGTITFTAYSDNLCVNDVFTDTVGPITANGDYDSADFTPANTGNFFWVASYSGDANNDPASTSCGDEGETSVVSPASPGITTLATAEVNLGSPISDTATISGLVNADGTGTITFTAYSDNTCATSVFSSTVSPITANGDYNSGNFTPGSAGTYYWIASFSGDGNNDPASTSCGDEGETSVVSPASPGITTLATAEVNLGSPISDTATISGLVNADGTGTITFTAYSDNTCATSVFSSTVSPITANGDYNSGNFTPGSAGTYYWIASFSGDGNNDPATTACGDPGESSIVKQQVQSQITPTATTCQQFRDGTAATLTAVNYSVRNSLISQVNPGVFFYWIKVDAIAGSNTFTISQDITSLNFGTYFAKAAGSALWTSSCTKVNSAQITQDGYPLNGDVTVSFNASSAGTYIIGIKYDSGSVKGVAPPTGSGIAHYTFSVNGTGSQGLDLKPKS